MSKVYDTIPKDFYVQAIFNSIASKYDLMNGMMSFGIHYLWRKVLIQFIQAQNMSTILDVCCGTGAVTIELARKSGPNTKIIGLDFSKAMLGIAETRLKDFISAKKVELIQANATTIPFSDDSFDGVTIAYGLRNAADPMAVLKELKRVTKPGGKVVSLELIKPDSKRLQFLYNIYLHYWIPILGKILVHNGDAYHYLHDSIFSFIHQEQLSALFKKSGFQQIQCFRLKLGIATIHIGIKPL
ncbi:MAG TPA: bifunctional demethylmenaquinone methyltransferase/2-methoxy-6-polyprenyl-1,4-benzoquinol methylase UbiE [Firmicutes bacterium]|jgi:demethylmenaquinone methyltransferase / 2-methoxy-6-polyprenyl-1,4-benzoquinol methylase|nr:bifunctional demethylmenaquinone methyltransferase/2-methoxy-6-polyprenyl-1,4-benzoquinol methylase UbiE [Bacillota bacterium]